MKIVPIFEAKTHLSKLVEAVERGQEKEIVIARHGRPVARLVRLEDADKLQSRIGAAKGLFSVPPEMENDAEEIVALFQGRD